MRPAAARGSALQGVHGETEDRELRRGLRLRPERPRLGARAAAVPGSRSARRRPRSPTSPRNGCRRRARERVRPGIDARLASPTRHRSGTVVGISLAAACRLRFPAVSAVSRVVRSTASSSRLEPRSIYRAARDARWRWQHHVPRRRRSATRSRSGRCARSRTAAVHSIAAWRRRARVGHDALVSVPPTRDARCRPSSDSSGRRAGRRWSRAIAAERVRRDRAARAR
jgi:hypothetical protein